jgi:hypothetical protein
VPHDQISAPNPHPVYDEDALASALQAGRSVLLLGQLLEGKSRTVYTIVNRLIGFHVVKPYKDKPVPPADAFGEYLLDAQNAPAGCHVL